jgi:hypothetical protein
MNLKTILLISTFAISSFFLNAQEYPLNEKGKTTKKGVEQYVLDKDSTINEEFNKKFKVNSYRNYFYVDDISLYDSKDSKGIYLGKGGGGEIIIDSENSFENYSVEFLSKEKINSFTYNDDFVRGVMFHEKTHGYLEQIKNELKHKKILPHFREKDTMFEFRSSFIEEGIAQYCAWKFGEIISPGKYVLPKNTKELIKNKSWEIEYKYSMYFVKDFLDLVGLKFGAEILLTNSPPTIEEMMSPKLFYSRLKHHGGLDLKFFKPQDFKSK